MATVPFPASSWYVREWKQGKQESIYQPQNEKSEQRITLLGTDGDSVQNQNLRASKMAQQRKLSSNWSAMTEKQEMTTASCPLIYLYTKMYTHTCACTHT